MISVSPVAAPVIGSRIPDPSSSIPDRGSLIPYRGSSIRIEDPWPDVTAMRDAGSTIAD